MKCCSFQIISGSLYGVKISIQYPSGSLMNAMPFILPVNIRIILKSSFLTVCSNEILLKHWLLSYVLYIYSLTLSSQQLFFNCFTIFPENLATFFFFQIYEFKIDTFEIHTLKISRFNFAQFSLRKKTEGKFDSVLNSHFG